MGERASNDLARLDQAYRERLAAETNDGGGRIVRQRTAEQKARGYGQDRAA